MLCHPLTSLSPGCKKGDNYYDLGDGRAFTSVEIWCTFGAETHGPFQLSQISNSAITEVRAAAGPASLCANTAQDEHSRYARVQEALWQTKKRHGPSDEAVQDAYDTWLAFVDRLVLDQAEALKMVRDRQENRAAFEKQQGERKAALPPPGAPPGPPPGAPPGSSARQGNASPVKGAYDGLMVADLNERNRKAEKERMAEVEVRLRCALPDALSLTASPSAAPRCACEACRTRHRSQRRLSAWQRRRDARQRRIGVGRLGIEERARAASRERHQPVGAGHRRRPGRLLSGAAGRETDMGDNRDGFACMQGVPWGAIQMRSIISGLANGKWGIGRGRTRDHGATVGRCASCCCCCRFSLFCRIACRRRITSDCAPCG
jgi:hypothetical protein